MSDLILIVWQPILIGLGLVAWGFIIFWLWCLVLSLHDVWRGRKRRHST